MELELTLDVIAATNPPDTDMNGNSATNPTPLMLAAKYHTQKLFCLVRVRTGGPVIEAKFAASKRQRTYFQFRRGETQ